MLGIIWGLIWGVIAAIGFLISSGTPEMQQAKGMFGPQVFAGLSILMVIIGPIFGAIVGLIAGIISVALYNIGAFFIGGRKL